jgi:hypothetical protein
LTLVIKSLIVTLPFKSCLDIDDLKQGRTEDLSEFDVHFVSTSSVHLQSFCYVRVMNITSRNFLRKNFPRKECWVKEQHKRGLKIFEIQIQSWTKKNTQKLAFFLDEVWFIQSKAQNKRSWFYENLHHILIVLSYELNSSVSARKTMRPVFLEEINNRHHKLPIPKPLFAVLTLKKTENIWHSILL